MALRRDADMRDVRSGWKPDFASPAVLLAGYEAVVNEQVWAWTVEIVRADAEALGHCRRVRQSATWRAQEVSSDAPQGLATSL